MKRTFAFILLLALIICAALFIRRIFFSGSLEGKIEVSGKWSSILTSKRWHYNFKRYLKINNGHEKVEHDGTISFNENGGFVMHVTSIYEKQRNDYEGPRTTSNGGKIFGNWQIENKLLILTTTNCNLATNEINTTTEVLTDDRYFNACDEFSSIVMGDKNNTRITSSVKQFNRKKIVFSGKELSTNAVTTYLLDQNFDE